MILKLSIAVLAFLALAGYAEVKPQNNYGGFDLVDKAGNIRRPADFRDRYQALGTYMILNAKGNEMHATYASPGTAENYRKTGKFADGTVLVKATRNRCPRACGRERPRPARASRSRILSSPAGWGEAAPWVEE